MSLSHKPSDKPLNLDDRALKLAEKARQEPKSEVPPAVKEWLEMDFTARSAENRKPIRLPPSTPRFEVPIKKGPEKFPEAE